MARYKTRLTDPFSGDDRGAVVVLVAILVVVLVAMAAFVVDMGYARATQQQLQASADSAALAGAGVLATHGVYCQPNATNSSATVIYPGGDDTTVVAAAVSAAKSYDAKNREQGFSTNPTAATSSVSAPNCVHYTDPTVSLDRWYPTLAVNNEQQLHTMFGRILGQDTITPKTTANAIVQAVSAQYTGLRPYGVCSADGSALSMMEKATKTRVARIEFVKGNGNGSGNLCVPGSTPGNWGILDFADGPNSTGTIEEWTESGYRGTIPPLPWAVKGNPGEFQPWGAPK